MEEPLDEIETTEKNENCGTQKKSDTDDNAMEGIEEEEGDEEEDDDDDEEEDEDDDDEEDEGVENEDDETGDWATDEEEDDEEGEEDDDCLLDASDSDGDTESERCPICLNRFLDQDLGTPEACDHIFCLECIQEWSRNVNTCPVDRSVFHLILCKHAGQEKIYKKINVGDVNKQAEDEEVEEDLTYCEVCNNCDREDRLLLCDGCDHGYHLDCLTPPLEDVPVDEWFCPQCAPHRAGATAEESDEEEAALRRRHCRRIPRTLVMERVRSAIEESRVRRMQNIRRILSSSEDEEEDAAAAEVNSPSSSATASTANATVTKKSPVKKRSPTKRKTPLKYKRKTRRKRKSTTGKKTTKKRKRKSTGKKRKTRRRKTRGKKKARTVKPSTVQSVKSRIAGALGITSPPPGRTIPLQKSKSDKNLELKRDDIGASSLSIFGSRDTLLHFEEDTKESPNTSGVKKLSRLSLSSRRPIGRVPILPLIKSSQPKKIVINTTPASASGGPLDLLGSIMSDQQILHRDSKDITIRRDGSLSAKHEKEEAKKEEDATMSEKSPAGDSSLFRSSFTAVAETSSSSSKSVLQSLSAQQAKKSEPEEYDPAHPTDELEDDDESGTVSDNTAGEGVKTTEPEEYDPAHPTDELENSDAEDSDKNMQNEEETPKESNDLVDNYDDVSEDDNKVCESEERENVEEEEEEVEEGSEGGEEAEDNAEDSDGEIKSDDEANCDVTTADNVESNLNDLEDISEEENDVEIELSKEKTEPNKTSVIDLRNKLNSNASKNLSTPEKDKVSLSSKSNSAKKTSPNVKPFEIAKRSLHEKKQLYSGEMDFTDDIGFSEGGFPENFEVSIKRIEEVFKDTKKSQRDEKADEKEEKKDESRKKDSEKKEESKSLGSKFKPIVSESTPKTKEKKTVGERFKMISEETPYEVIEIDDEEEDPIHEMRKLDKELDLELENREGGKRKDHKRSKRKVSIDNEDSDRSKYRKDGKENRKGEHGWEEVEEGEVEEEYRYREKKRKEKKKKRSEKDRYYDEEPYGDAEKEGDLDTRIVIQVSQNTDNRTVWEEDERLKRKKEKEERRKDRDRSKDKDYKKERKHKRHRSRSRSYDKKDRSRSRDRRRSRSRSRDRSRRKHRDRSRSRSRSVERSHKKKKKDRDRSRERNKHRSRERSEDNVDMFGRSRSPFKRKDVPMDTDIIITSSKSVKTAGIKIKTEVLDSEPSPKKKKRLNDGEIIIIDSVSSIEVKDSTRAQGNTGEKDEKDDDFDDEPEETEQFQYTDRDEYLSQNKFKQKHTNLIQIGVNGSDYDPANPTEASSPPQPPLPDSTSAPTPPLPPVGDFSQFPPPPPGPPPPGPPPPGMIIQERPVQVSGPPGQGLLGEGPMLLQGPPPSLEQGPPPGMLQHRPVNINVMPPPGFHRGLPQTMNPQRQLIMNPFRPGMPPMPRLQAPPRFGWQITTSGDQFQGRGPSPSQLSGPPPLINSPYDGLPPPHSEHNLPPGHPQFPGEPPHVLPLQPDGPPPPNVVQISLEEPRHMNPGGPEILRLGPPRPGPQPRLPIPLLPTSEPPPISVMVSVPPPNTPLMSMPAPVSNREPPVGSEAFSGPGTATNTIASILGLPKLGTTATPSTGLQSIPGLDMVGGPSGGANVANGKPEANMNQLEEISKLLNTQAKLMLSSKGKMDGNKAAKSQDKSGGKRDIDVFKRPLPPGVKGSSKSDGSETNEVIDMDMASPILEEGNIELPVSPLFDNLIDNAEDLLEEEFNKKTQQKNNDKKLAEEKELYVKDKSNTPTKTKDAKDDLKKASPHKSKEERGKRSSKENKHRHGHRHNKPKAEPEDKDNFHVKALTDARLDLDSQELPSSAVELTNKEKYLKKLHLQERVVEEVKMAIKPHYAAKKINKDQYKDILRKAVPKICHSKSGNINPMKIKALVEAYIEKFVKVNSGQGHTHKNKKPSSPSVKANGERAKPKAAR